MSNEQLNSQLKRAKYALKGLYDRLADTNDKIETLKKQLKKLPENSIEYLNISGTIYLLGVSKRTITLQINDLEARITAIENVINAQSVEQVR